ncbi:MAG: amidohydrolase family protein [Candidatus Lokiarchaeota archaeon]|nr:amidohydrolase family protein [Candidatus Lokiarchaeota archaeon]
MSTKSVFTKHILMGIKVENDRYINIKDGRIVSITADPEFDDSIVDLGRHSIVFPGLINTHSHAFQSLLKGYTDDCTLEVFLKIVYSKLEEFTIEDIYNGSRLAFSEMLQNGITTVCDFFYINGAGNGNAKAVIKAARDVGLRINLMRSIIDLPGKSKKVREDIDNYKTRFNALYAQYEKDENVVITPCAHSVYYCTEEAIRSVKDIAQNYSVKWQIHFSDSQGTRDYCQTNFGKSNAEYMADNQLMDENMVGVHGIWCDKQDIEIMANHKISLSHNPLSNQFLGERPALISEMLNNGIKVGLGTDGAASNPSLSILNEMRHAVLIQKARLLDPSKFGSLQGFKMGTEHGGHLSGFEVGKFAKGFWADFMVCDTRDPTLNPYIEKALSYMVYSLSPRAIRKVYIGGKEV